LEITQGPCLVEVRHRGVSKARVLEKVMAEMAACGQAGTPTDVDFIFCVGDDRSDEDMFQLLNRFRDDESAALALAAAAEAADQPSVCPETPQPTRGATGGGATAPLPVSFFDEPEPPTYVSEVAPAVPPPRRPPDIFTVHIGSDASQATSFVESTFELRRVLRALASVSKKDADLRDLGFDPTAASDREADAALAGGLVAGGNLPLGDGP
jgi:hypothetical protein